MMDPMTIMSVADVAQYLRVDVVAVRRLIKQGSIPSFEVDGHPRVQYGSLVQWFQSETQARSLETLRQQFQKPATWQSALEQEPKLRDRLLSEEQEEGTFGAFLKEVLLADPPSDETEEAFVPASISVSSSAVPQPTPAGDKTEYISHLCRRPVVAIFVAIGVTVIAIAAFTDALRKIWEFFHDCINSIF